MIRREELEPSVVAAHISAALELLDEHLRRHRKPVPGWIRPAAALFRAWAGSRDAAAVVLSPPSLLLTYAEAGHLLGLAERTVRDRVAAGELPAVRLGGSVRLRRAELEDFVRSRPHVRQIAADTGQSRPTSHGLTDRGHGEVDDNAA